MLCTNPLCRQAALTGESMPAAKSARAERSSRHHAPTSLLDCRCLAFRGTHVVSGAARVLAHFSMVCEPSA